MLFFGRPLEPPRLHTAGLAFLLAVSASAPLLAEARQPALHSEAVIVRSELPREALATERAIRTGGPFPYPQDASVFGNRERLLPARPRGYWREYTVDTPGAGNRGARRIVCGGEPPAAPASCYYTDDHYASFRRIVQ